MNKLFILILKDETDNYQDTIVKVYAKDIQDVQNKLKTVDINKLVEKDYPDKNYNFCVASFCDVDLLTEVK